MGIYCPLCEENIVVWSSLCGECHKIKKLCSLYSRDDVIKILDNVLLRKELGIKKKTLDESNKYIIKKD